ncbi:MAG: OsmC family protein [Candidatus Nitrosopolaris sp.]
MISWTMNKINRVENKIEQVEQKLVNGVNVTKLFDIMDGIRSNPVISKFNIRAKGKWIKGGHNQTTINDFYGACQTHSRSRPFVYDEDEPPILLGEDHGANAGEYALAALSSCLTTTLIYHAAAQGVVIDEVETTLSGDADLQGFLGMSKNVRNGYEKIKVAFKVKSKASKEKVRELVELAQKRSPVFDIISNPTPIEISLQE